MTTEPADEQPDPRSIARPAPVPSGGVQDRSGEGPFLDFPPAEPAPTSNQQDQDKTYYGKDQ